ncbi:MAG: hypothetical protein IPK04_06485 [Bdellovibrionales bacterium]|nr:hypothetical protein [Bdellovibrionales bacterium]
MRFSWILMLLLSGCTWLRTGLTNYFGESKDYEKLPNINTFYKWDPPQYNVGSDPNADVIHNEFTHTFQVRYNERNPTWKIDPKRTAILVVDMWSDHSCLELEERGKQLAPKLNNFISTMRDRGFLIIHSPSETEVDFYKQNPFFESKLKSLPNYTETPPTKQIVLPETMFETPITGWKQGKTDWFLEWRGCKSELQRPYSRDRSKGWWPSAQTPLIPIEKKDYYIGDQRQDLLKILNFHKIDTVLYTGVHADVCIVGRQGFGMPILRARGHNIALVRDLSDTTFEMVKPILNREEKNGMVWSVD